ncbi:hypothetical protein GCM10025861_16830 [Methanobacterium petrolearium]|nr:hypothetical protein GCM10025861_16830 [Methanobacterium petrolearium]
MRHRFEQELGDTVEEENITDLEGIFNAYLDWVARLFADFGVQTEIETKGQVNLFKFHNCPWLDDAKKIQCSALTAKP